MKHLKMFFLPLLLFFVSFCLFCLPIGHQTYAKIVCAVDDHGIWVMNDNGSAKRKLTNMDDGYPRWSPDGKEIVFVRYTQADGQKSEIYLINANGTNQQQLINIGEKNGYPAWSPDGKRIAFRSDHSGRLEIYVLTLADRTIKQLTGVEEEHGGTAPDWSPDGQEIVYEKFIRQPGLAHKNIWVMNADGTNQRPLLPDPKVGEPPIFRSGPQWSPDGKKILFAESKGGALGGDTRFTQLVIQTIGGTRKEIDIREKIGGKWVGSKVRWMDNGRAILFDAEVLINVRDDVYPYYLYRYEIATQRLSKITRPPDRYYDNPDWIEGTLSVSPQGKKKVTWGMLKQ